MLNIHLNDRLLGVDSNEPASSVFYNDEMNNNDYKGPLCASIFRWCLGAEHGWSPMNGENQHINQLILRSNQVKVQ